MSILLCVKCACRANFCSYLTNKLYCRKIKSKLNRDRKIKKYSVRVWVSHPSCNAPNKFSFRAQPKNYVIASRLVRRGNLVETKRQTIAPDKFFISFRLYKSFAFETLNRNAPSFRSVPVFLPPLVWSTFSTKLSVARGEDRRHSHRKVSSPCYATSPAWRLAQHSATHSRTTVLLGAYLGVRLANAHFE